jgi:Zn-dependent protease
MLLFVGFGWAKPVPVNPNNLKNTKVSMGMVSAAGPLMNLIGAIVFGIMLRFAGPMLGPQNLLVNFLFLLVLINVILMVFNLIPIPPLDGSKVLFSILPDKYNDFKVKLSMNGPFILIMLLLLDNILNLGIFSTIFSWTFQIVEKFM